MEPFARAAMEHARSVWQREIGEGDLQLADEVLQFERQHPSADPEMISLSYGAWFGKAIQQKFSASWTGLHEPVPPRLTLPDRQVSPVDAVSRILHHPEAPSLTSLFQDLIRSTSRSFDPQEAFQANRNAWRGLAELPAFRQEPPPPPSPVAREGLDPWLLEILKPGIRVLCLAAAGGTHAPLLASAGARVTVHDFCPELLEIDRQWAARHQVAMDFTEASMDDLERYPSESFDLVLQPVSTCYLPSLIQLHAGLARILKAGGHYIVQHKQPAALQFGGTAHWMEGSANIEGFPLPPVPPGTPYRESGTQEYLHTLDSLLGGLCRSGFLIRDVRQSVRADAWAPTGTPEQIACFLPPYLQILAMRFPKSDHRQA